MHRPSRPEGQTEVSQPRRKLILGALAMPILTAARPATAFFPLLLRGLLFTGARRSIVGRAASGSAGLAIPGRAMASPRPVRRRQVGWRQEFVGQETYPAAFDSYGYVIRWATRPIFRNVPVYEDEPPTYVDASFMLTAENQNRECFQSFTADFFVEAPQGPRVWAGTHTFCVSPGSHQYCVILPGVPSGWNVYARAETDANYVETNDTFIV